jgi:hypothetical protein
MAGEKRYETVGFEFAETWIDMSTKAQERTSKFGESYLKLFQEGQKASFDLMQSWLKLTHDLQSLSFNYAKESARTRDETLSGLMRVQDEVQHDLKNHFDQQVNELEKVAKAAK